MLLSSYLLNAEVEYRYLVVVYITYTKVME